MQRSFDVFVGEKGDLPVLFLLHLEANPYLFILLMISFSVQKLLSLIRAHLFIFVSISFTLVRWIEKDTAAIYVRECSVFSSKSFIVSGPTLGSSINFEFVFVCGVKVF